MGYTREIFPQPEENLPFPGEKSVKLGASNLKLGTRAAEAI